MSIGTAAMTPSEIAISLRRDILTGQVAPGSDLPQEELARRFGVMGRRLRANAAQLLDAERRATRGEMARQVNHDVKNGLIPIRNVVQHLAEVQQHEPERLPAVFAERRATLEKEALNARNRSRVGSLPLKPID